MTEQEYKICVSETPELLTSEVSEHLSQGWDLHGYPFLSGHSKPYCQAVVRLASSELGLVGAKSKTSAKVAPLKAAREPRPARPRVAVSFRNVAAFLAVTIGSYLLIEALIFRSGLYARYLEPESHAGAFENLTWNELHRKPSGKKEILVLGSSRMAEDFSARIANMASSNDGYWFINGAIPHGRDRSWYYFVREIDPHRNRYKSIMIPLEDYDDPDTSDDIPDRVVDLRLVISRLRLTDILPFTFSFRTWKARFEVLRGSLLKGVAYQLDFQQFFEDPATRLFRAPEWQVHEPDWFYAYGGIQHALTGLEVDWKSRSVVKLPPDNQGPNWQKFYDDGLIDNTPQNGIVRANQVRWLGDLVDLYRGSSTRIIVYQVPRGPSMPPYPRAHLPWTTVDVLAKRPWVTIVDRHRFESLEKPELFGDLLHLNSDGRAIFTPMLANLAKETVH